MIDSVTLLGYSMGMRWILGGILVSFGHSFPSVSVSSTTADPREFEPTDDAGNVLFVTEPVPEAYLDDLLFNPVDLLVDDDLMVPSDFENQAFPMDLFSDNLMVPSQGQQVAMDPLIGDYFDDIQIQPLAASTARRQGTLELDIEFDDDELFSIFEEVNNRASGVKRSHDGHVRRA